MRRGVLAGVAALTIIAGAAGLAQSQVEPAVDHVSVRAGEGLWQVAGRLCPHAVGAQFTALQRANPWYTVGLHPGTVLHLPEASCPPEDTTTSTSSTTTTTVVPVPAGFPTPETTGARLERCPTMQQHDGQLTTSAAGQVIECVEVFGNLRVQHDNVTVRDVIVHGTAPYMIYVRNLGGNTANRCPTDVVVEHVEVDASAAEADDIPVYGRCGATFDHLYVHGGGAAIRLVSNSTVTNSYYYGNRRLGDQHRTALSMHGGADNRVIGNTLICGAPPGVAGSGGCSAALSIYGDFGVPDGFLVERNLLATSGVYCMYGGSGHPTSNQYPEGYDVHIVRNHFSTMLNRNCGSTGPLTAWDVYDSTGEFVRGNFRCGNVWHETGLPVWPDDEPC